MLTYRYPLIAREGWLWIALTAAGALLAQWLLGWIALPLWLIPALLLFLFRDPPRQVPASPLGIVSPVDGQVLAIETLSNPWLDRPGVRIVIGMRALDIFSVRSPMEGKVVEQWIARGPGREGGRKPGMPQGPHFAQWIQSDEEDDLVLVIAPGIGALSPRCYVHSGERIGQGQRCGFLHFGGRVEVWVPEGTRIEVAEGDTVQAGSDIIATLVHEKVVPPKIDEDKVDSVPASGDH